MADKKDKLYHEGKEFPVVYEPIITCKLKTQLDEHYKDFPLEKMQLALQEVMADIEPGADELKNGIKLLKAGKVTPEELFKYGKGAYKDIEYEKQLDDWYIGYYTLIVHWRKTNLEFDDIDWLEQDIFMIRNKVDSFRKEFKI